MPSMCYQGVWSSCPHSMLTERLQPSAAPGPQARSLLESNLLTNQSLCARVDAVSSAMSDFVMLWTIAHQAPLSMGCSRQEYWSGLPCPPPRDLPDPGIKPTSLMSPALAGRFCTTSTIWEAPSQPLPTTNQLVDFPPSPFSPFPSFFSFLLLSHLSEELVVFADRTCGRVRGWSVKPHDRVLWEFWTWAHPSKNLGIERRQGRAESSAPASSIWPV